MKRVLIALSLAAVLSVGFTTPAFAGVKGTCVRECARKCGFSKTMNPGKCLKNGCAMDCCQ